MDTVPSTSSWVPGIGILAGKRSCLEVPSFLSSMFSGNMVAQAYKGDDDGGGGNHMRVPVPYRITPTVGTVGFLFQEAQPSVP